MSRTIKVRIAVAVDPDGNWNSYGCNKHSTSFDDYNKFAMELASEAVSEGEARFWIEAELPIPESVVVENVIVSPVVSTEIIHLCPQADSGITPCCGKTPFELPLTDRLSSNPNFVTCGKQ